MGTNVVQLADRLRSEADAYRFVEELRWGSDEPTCPHCGTMGATYIEPANGVSRRTRTGAMSERRVWRCRSCRKQFSAITGTVFHGTKVPLRTWVLVVFEMVASKNGIAAREVERKYGVCARTAWFMMHRIREAMGNDGLLETIRGTLVADETFVGGAAKFMHKSNPRRREQTQGGGGKAVVLSLIHDGQVRSKVIPDVTGATLRKAIAEQCDMDDTILHTDTSRAYASFCHEFAAHATVNHSADQYVRYTPLGIVSTNQAENFFSQFKRSIDGTHHHVSREHLGRYVDEFDFRYNTRKATDAERMGRLMRRVGGRRLTYKRTTGA